MVKRREPQASVASIVRREPTPEQVEAFASEAEGNISTNDRNSANKALPTAKETFKSIRLPLTEAEYKQLHEAAQKTGRSKASFIRRAILEKSEAVLERNEVGA